MKLIAQGQRKFDEVLSEAIDECRKIFNRVLEQEFRLKDILKERMEQNRIILQPDLLKETEANKTLVAD